MKLYLDFKLNVKRNSFEKEQKEIIMKQDNFKCVLYCSILD